MFFFQRAFWQYWAAYDRTALWPKPMCRCIGGCTYLWDWRTCKNYLEMLKRTSKQERSKTKIEYLLSILDLNMCNLHTFKAREWFTSLCMSGGGACMRFSPPPPASRSSSRCWRKRPKQPWPAGWNPHVFQPHVVNCQSDKSAHPLRILLSLPKLLPGKAPEQIQPPQKIDRNTRT